MTEIQSYKVVSRIGKVEIREYPEHLLVSTQSKGSMAEAGNQSFRRLANFIFGGNNSGQKIAMTAPVLQFPQEKGFKTSFVMPATMRLDDLPGTSDPTLLVEPKPGGTYAALQFSGLATDELFSSKANELKKEVEASGKSVLGDAIYARYNGPWTPFFLRRNEVLIQLQD